MRIDPRVSILCVLLTVSFAAGAAAQSRLGAGDEATEYWDLTAAFDSGHRVFARFSITNAGPGNRTAYAVGQVVFPDGAVVPFQNGRLDGSWDLSPDGRRLKIGSSVLDLGPAMHHFEVDKNKKGVKIFFDFDPRHAPLRWSGAPSGIDVELLALGAPITGNIWVRDQMQGVEPERVTGRVSLTHAWMDATEPAVLRRRLEVHRLTGEGPPAYLAQLESVNAHGRGDPQGWLVIGRDEGEWEETAVGLATMGVHGESPAGYPVPAAIEISGPDPRGRVDIGSRILDHDPLDLVPRLLRWFLTPRADPLHVWLESRLELRWAGARPAASLEGPGLVSVFFTNPAPRP